MTNFFKMFSEKVHRAIFLFGTALLVIGLPVSYFLLSVAILLLALNWVLDFRNPKKYRILKEKKSLWFIISIYLVHVIWLFNTVDFDYALHDLRIKSPFLALPVIYATSGVFTKKEFRIILLLFVGTVIVNSIISTYVLFGFSKLDPVDSRGASLFISHIRFSLMVVLSIFILAYLAFFNYYKVNRSEKILLVLAMLWLICFLVLLQSFTGIIVFLVLCPLSLIWWAHHLNKRRVMLFSYIATAIILITAIGYTFYSVYRFNVRHDNENTVLERYTQNGNEYKHYPKIDEYENGYAVWTYISEEELREEWNKRSEFAYDSLDRKGQKLRITLYRYMTSLGLRKDSVGISQLSEEDIQYIEKGYTNYIHKNKFALYPRIYEMLWEMKRYAKTGDPSGQSLGQRVEYLKVGFNIIKRHFWWGTGTGDVQREFYRQYDIDKTQLKPEWRHRTHNQFVTFFISFGLFGFLWVVFALFAPVWIEKKYTYYLFMVFFILGLMSMLNEDTLETHTGVSFFAFFYAFFMFSTPDK